MSQSHRKVTYIKSKQNLLRSVVLVVVNNNSTLIFDVTPYSLADGYQCFGGTATCIFR
jgi:hypothetical protein